MLRIAFILGCVFLFLSFVFVQNLLWKMFWENKNRKKKGDRPDSAWWPAGREAQPAQFSPWRFSFPPGFLPAR
jgi:hypothetical protein